MAVDSLKRTKNVDDKEDIIARVSTMKLDTLAGPIDFTIPTAAGTKRPVPNVFRTECAAGQWIKGTKYPFELVITSNAGHEIIPVAAKTTPLA